MKANHDIRMKAFEMDVYYWEIAKALGMRPETLSKLLREELNAHQKEKIMKVIELIGAPNGHGH